MTSPPGSGRLYDVRENVKFRGGYLARWVNGTWPYRACCLALEFRKSFMDEWTGQLDEERFAQLAADFAAVLPELTGRFQD